MMKFNKKDVFFLSNAVTVFLFVMLVFFVFRIVIVSGWLKIAQIGLAMLFLTMTIISLIGSKSIDIVVDKVTYTGVPDLVLGKLLAISFILIIIGLLPDTRRRLGRIKHDRAKAREKIKSKSAFITMDEDKTR